MGSSTWLVRLALPLARTLARRRRTRGRLRALWGATPILTLPLKARATALLGLESCSVVFQTYVITRNFDCNLRRIANGAARLGPWASRLADQFILAWALLRFDVIHYFHDRGLMRPAGRFGIRREELELLREAGKAVYLFAYGADVRTRERTLALGRWNFCTDCTHAGRYCICEEAAASTRAAEASRRVTAVVGMADMLPYLSDARRLDYWPVDTEALKAEPVRLGNPLRIAHAPNHTHFKGSRYLEAAIGKLCDEGHAIEYVKVQGVPNAKVLELFRSAHLVVDQLIGGAFGYTALEAMALGRPVLTYVRSSAVVEAEAECPLINATPTTIEETLRWCLANPDRLPAIGAQGRAYVERWHSITAVAERLGRLYEATMDLPDNIRETIRRQRAEAQVRREAVALCGDWHHPFRIGLPASPVVRAGEEILPMDLAPPGG